MVNENKTLNYLEEELIQANAKHLRASIKYYTCETDEEKIRMSILSEARVEARNLLELISKLHQRFELDKEDE